MKRLIRNYGIVLLFVCLLSSVVFADMGPKPSVTIKFRNFGEGEFYATLLSEDESTGPYSWASFRGSKAEPPMTEPEIWQAFVDYEDEDGFYFLQYYQRVERRQDEDGTYDLFTWDYYPPDRFKVLIYYPETGGFFACDEIMDAYSFDSYYEVTRSDPGELNLYIDRVYGYGWEILAFLVRLGLTVGFEIILAIAFGYKFKRQIFLIAGVNVVTQLALNIGLLAGGYPTIFFFYVLEYFVWEALVFAIEATIYILTLQKLDEPYQGNKHPIFYALTANAVSFVMGYVISQWFPFVF